MIGGAGFCPSTVLVYKKSDGYIYDPQKEKLERFTPFFSRISEKYTFTIPKSKSTT